MVLATALLGSILRNPLDAARGARLASAFTVAVVVVFCRRIWLALERGDPQWTGIGAAGGAGIGPFWLASGSYFRSGENPMSFFEAALGGLLYATPLGAIVGALCGALLAHSARVAGAWEGRCPRCAVVGLILLSAAEVVLALLLWHAFGLGRIVEPVWI